MDFSLMVACCFAGISLYMLAVATAKRLRRRWSGESSESSCYLEAEAKPQHSFKRILADNSYSQFKHLRLNDGDAHDSSNEKSLSSSLHPFEKEIRALLENPEVHLGVFNGRTGMEMPKWYTWVKTKSQLEELVEVLSKEKVIAVDTEQHSLRSFLGFTALVQVSTLKEDYLIDTIALHDVFCMIRPIFADRSICKVFHGADNDVLWLQRDFHIYIVNLFDTAKACEVLSKPQKSLAYLLESYCEVATNKLLQREDWRQRPLPLEMVEYARTDAHYLLHIFCCLIDELQQKNDACQDDGFDFLLEASRRSNSICLQLYMKDEEAFPGEAVASSLVSRHFPGQGVCPSISSNSQFPNLVGKLCAWRDLMARIHDESLRYVLSDHAIVALAMKLPTSESQIYDTIADADRNLDSSTSIFSLASPSPLIFSHWGDLQYLLKDDLGGAGDTLQVILQRCIGSNGTCSLSIFNYALLSRSFSKQPNATVYKQTAVRNVRRLGKKASRQLFVQKFSCKSPVYHNCRIYASDGRLLCYCDRRKLEWYLRRNLAKLLEDDPPAIMLLFEPKGRPEDEDNDFYIQSKKNMCVGCGEENHYLRYRIIPSCYRMHFPEHLKSHRSHDIVLLCVDCHEVAHAAAEKHKRQIAAEFGIPLFLRKVADPGPALVTMESCTSFAQEEAGVSPLQLRTAALALLRHGPRMPSNRCNELIEIVKRYYGGRVISHEDLESALLVGMSPHERRKVAKKRGLSFNFSEGRMLADKEHTSVVNGTNIHSVDDALNTDTMDQSNNTIGPAVDRLECNDMVEKMDVDKESSSLSELRVDGKGANSDTDAVRLGKDSALELKHSPIQTDSNGGNGIAVDGAVNPCLKSNSDTDAVRLGKDRALELKHAPIQTDSNGGSGIALDGAVNPCLKSNCDTNVVRLGKDRALELKHAPIQADSNGGTGIAVDPCLKSIQTRTSSSELQVDGKATTSDTDDLRLDKDRALELKHASIHTYSNGGSGIAVDPCLKSIQTRTSSSELQVDGEGTTSDTDDLRLDKDRALELKHAPIHTYSNGGSELVDRAIDPCLKWSQTTTLNNSKVSLLGHGPHGKQVVDYLLERYGEDGIQSFCHRWRQVFVDSVRPRYLPTGWNIMHSGRRDFGEFSVYNPTKKASAAPPNV